MPGSASTKGMDQDAEKSGPVRKCIVSGEVHPARDLLRFVVGPDGEAVFDAAGKLPGRGLWLSPRQDMLKTAATKNVFSKAARTRVTVADDLVAQVGQTLTRQCLKRLGLARRAGLLTQGFEKVRQALKGNASALDGAVLIEAADGALDGREKLARLARAVDADVAEVALFTAEDIGRAIGRDNAVHALIGPGKMAEAFLCDARKLAGVKNVPLNGVDGDEGPMGP